MSFEPIHLELPMLAIPKARPRVFRSGVVMTPQKSVNFEAELRGHWYNSKHGVLPQVPTLVEVTCYLPMPKTLAKKRSRPKYPVTKPDLDNLAKAILDGLNGFAWRDDSQVAQLNISKIYTLESPSIFLSILPLEAA